MKKILVIYLSSLLFNCIHSQDIMDFYKIGYFYDINNQIISGYYDIDYEPKNSLKVKYTFGDEYSPGYYYDLNNNKHKGLLKYSQRNTYFKFKYDNQSKEKTIKPDKCKGYVIGVDSFCVIQNFNVQRDLGAFFSRKKEFAEVIDKVGNLTFYKHYRVTHQNIVTTYLVKPEDSSEYTSFPKSVKKFKETLIKVFGEFEALKEDINSGKYGTEYDDILVMIKLLKYRYINLNGGKLFFNSSWDEIENDKEYSYYAIIESLKDSLFHIKYYFSNGIPIYEGDFKSFYPHEKEGEFIWYYPNGQIRKKTNYIDNEPKRTVSYYKNGKVHHEYRIIEGNTIYDIVSNAQGKNVLDNNGNGKEVFYDSIMKRRLIYDYVNYKLISSYFFDSNNRKIFQSCTKNAKLKSFKALSIRIEDEIDYPKSSIEDYNHGFVLVRCIIEPTGLTSDIKIIKGIDPACDFAALKFMSSFMTNKSWRPGKDWKEKITQEIVIPIDFSLNGFSRYRNHYNHFFHHDYFFHHNHMLEHQRMIQQQIMKQYTPPKIPSFRY